MEKYILELITENNRVIIPNFGAFIVSNELGVSILFNNFLSFNDGLLVNYVAEKKGIDTIIATDQVFDFVDRLKKELDETGAYSINKVGIFKKDDNGILRFQQTDDFSDNFENTEILDQNVQIQKKDILLDIDNDISLEPNDEEKQDSINDDDYYSNNEPDNLLTIDTEPETIITTQNEHQKEKDNIESTENENKVIIEDSIPIKDEHINESNSSDASPKAEKSKKSRNIIILIAILCILISGSVIYFTLLRNHSKELNIKPQVEVKIEKPVLQKSIKKDSIEITIKEPKKKQKPIIEHIVTNTKGLTHIIVGGFKEEDNAIRLVEKLRKLGHKKAQILTKKNMFLVSIDSDTSYQKMETIQQQILETEKRESWMYSTK